MLYRIVDTYKFTSVHFKTIMKRVNLYNTIFSNTYILRSSKLRHDISDIVT